MGIWGGISGLGPAAPVLESVFGSVAGAVGQSGGSGVVGGFLDAPGVPAALMGMQNAFGRLFGGNLNNLPQCPLQPPSFGAGSIPPQIGSNPLQFLQDLESELQQLGNSLQAVLQQSQAPAAAPSANPLAQPTASTSPAVDPANQALGAINSGNFSFLDNMQQQIETLMGSSNPSDQIKAQMLMNQFSQLVDMITSMLAKQRELESKIAQNMAQ
jgi:hypothetical protein